MVHDIRRHGSINVDQTVDRPQLDQGTAQPAWKLDVVHGHAVPLNFLDAVHQPGGHVHVEATVCGRACNVRAMRQEITALVDQQE